MKHAGRKKKNEIPVMNVEDFLRNVWEIWDEEVCHPSQAHMGSQRKVEKLSTAVHSAEKVGTGYFPSAWHLAHGLMDFSLVSEFVRCLKSYSPSVSSFSLIELDNHHVIFLQLVQGKLAAAVALILRLKLPASTVYSSYRSLEDLLSCITCSARDIRLHLTRQLFFFFFFFVNFYLKLLPA
jgi:hypothetical protein